MSLHETALLWGDRYKALSLGLRHAVPLWYGLESLREWICGYRVASPIIGGRVGYMHSCVTAGVIVIARLSMTIHGPVWFLIMIMFGTCLFYDPFNWFFILFVTECLTCISHALSTHRVVIIRSYFPVRAQSQSMFGSNKLFVRSVSLSRLKRTGNTASWFKRIIIRIMINTGIKW